MPWTAEDMKAKGAKRPELAARVANAVRGKCIAAGGDEKTCDGRAIRIALAQSNRGAQT
uniref:Uncharacterized protein n=1 Tax=viral metagenome TaxID=1070528 RepID=A0A6H1ZGW8_9ZZZZ